MNQLEMISEAIKETKSRQRDLLNRQQAAEGKVEPLRRKHYEASLGGLGAADKAGRVDEGLVGALEEQIRENGFAIAALKDKLRTVEKTRSELEGRYDRLRNEAAACVVKMNAALLPVLWACVTGPESVEAEIGPMRERYRAIAGDAIIG